MEFRVLGPIEVRRDDIPIDVGGPRPRTVLALLVAEAGRVVSLDRLQDGLWGETPPDSARTILHGLVAGLRRALEPNRQPNDPPAVLVSQPPGYVLRVAPEEVDAHRFEILVADGRRRFDAGHLQEARTILRDALALWRGPPYADVRPAPLLEVEAARLEALKASARDMLAEVRLAAGEHATAAEELRQLVAEDPLREGRWALYLLALYRSGRPAEAQRAFAEARTTLADRLGIDPSPALRELGAAIARHDPTLDWHPPAGEAPSGGRGARARFARHDLVGRHEELSALTDRLAYVAAGAPHVVLVAGEAGIGKTRLVEELADRATERGFAAAWGRCIEGGGAALWPWVQIVRESDPSLPELASFVESEATGAPFGLEMARARLHHAVTSVLVRASRRRPLLVVVEDLHWADVASVRLLLHLVRNLGGAPLMVAVTYRDSGAENTEALTEALAALARVRGVTRIALTGLSAEDVGRLASRALGSHPSEPAAAELHRRTAGNPFFVVEVAQLLATETEPGAIPQAVRDVVRHRLTRLSEPARNLVSVAAVVGREFDLEILRRAGPPMGEDEMLDALEEALDAAIVVEGTGGSGPLRFAHDLVRETLYNQLSALRRARLHRRVGQALVSRGGTSDRVAVLAYHFWHAVAAGSADEAFAYALAAAELDMARYGSEDAEVHLSRALILAERLPPSDERDRRELLVREQLGLLLLMTRGYAAPEVGAAAAAAREVALRRGDADGALASTWRLLSFHILRAEYTDTAELAGSLVAGRDAAATAVGQQALGVVALCRGQLDPAAEHLTGAISHLAAVGDDPRFSALEVHPSAFARAFLALQRWLQGDAGPAKDALNASLGIARRLDRPYGVSFCLAMGAALAAVAARPGDARELAEEALAIAERYGFGLLRPIAAAVCGWADAELGEPVSGNRRLLRGLRDAGAAGARQWSSLYFGLQAQVRWRRGLSGSALSSIEAALAFADTTGERFYEPELHRLRGEILLAQPRPDRPGGTAALAAAAALASQQGSRVFGARAQAALDRARQSEQ